MNNQSRVLWVTQSAVFIALVIVAQMVTSSLGNTLVTGSVVNLMLIVSVMSCGLPVGVMAALLSPVFALLLGIGPQMLHIIPVQMLGNLTLVFLWDFIGNRPPVGKMPAVVIALAVAAAAKFLVLYIGVVLLLVPIILQLREPQASVIAGLFSIPQLITALIGGALALVVLPLVRRAIGKR